MALSWQDPSGEGTPMRPLAVEMTDVVGRYPGATEASLQSVSLHVTQGALFGLLGPNGAGKSTLLALLCGLMRPESGSVRVFGHRFDEGRERFKEAIGLVPQSIALYQRLSGRENLKVFGGMSGLSGKALARRMQYALEVSRLDDRADQRVAAYSGGLQRRLNLAIALLSDPPLLVLDEPTVGIDPQSRHAIHETLRQLHGQGKTIVFTSHYLDEIEQLCDYVAILDQGSLLTAGPLAALLAQSTEERISLDMTSSALEQPAAALRLLAGVREVAVVGSKLIIQAPHPYDVLPAILACLAALHLRPAYSAIGRDSLEQVFFTLTGTRLREPA